MLPLPSTSPLHQAYLQQFLSTGTSCPTIKKIPRYTKRQKKNKNKKKQFEEIEQASEPDMARILELSNQELRRAMINMLRALLDKK